MKEIDRESVINVAIVEDIDEIRFGLATLISGSPGFKCSGAYESAEEALAHIPKSKTDVVLMDIELPRMSGIECIVKLKQKMPSVQVMVLTVFEDEDKIFESLRAGACGYILKKTPPAKLLEAIEEIHRGGSPMSGGIARKVVQAFGQMGPVRNELEALSPREQEILFFLAKGFRYQEIADKFFISVETVRTHLHRIYEKLHVRSRTEAVLKYLQK
jgi:DNA-binding NarL/FixJ family response regulator